MKRLPKIRDVISHVKTAAEKDESIKTAAEAQPPVELQTDVGKSLHQLAQRIKTASVDEVTLEDVLALGKRLTEKTT